MADTKYEWDGSKYVPFKNTPGAYVIEWDGMDWVPSKNPEGPGAFTRGLATGFEQTKGILSEALPAMVQSALGYDDAARANLQAYKERMDRLDKAGLQAKMTYEDVNSLGTLYDYGAEAFGQALPSMVTALIPGVGLGAAGTRLAAGRAATGLVASRAAAIESAAQAAGQTVTKEAAYAAAMQQVSQQIGTVAGVMLGSGLQNVPESFANIYDETQQLRPGVAFAVGSLKSALDSIAPVMLLRKTQGVEMGDRLTNLISSKLLKGRPGWSGALAGALETAATEGLTEGAQELLDQAAVNVLADKTFNWKEVVDAALKGGIGAAPVGGAAGAYGARRTAQAEEDRVRQAEEQKAEQEAIAAQQRAAQTKKIESQRAAYLNAVQLPEAYAAAREYDPGKLLGPEAPITDKIKRKLAMRQNLSTDEEGALVNMSPQEFERYIKLSLDEDPEIIKDIPEIGAYEFMNETPPPVPQGPAPDAISEIYSTVLENIPTTNKGSRDANQMFTPGFLAELGLQTTPEQNREVLARLVAEGEVVQKGAFFRFTTDAEKEAFDVRRDPKLAEALNVEKPDTKLQKRWLEKALGREIQDPTSVPKLFKMLEREGLVVQKGPYWQRVEPMQVDRKMRQRLFAMGYEPSAIEAMSGKEAYDIISSNTWPGTGNIPATQPASAQPVAPEPPTQVTPAAPTQVAPTPAPVQVEPPAPTPVASPLDDPRLKTLLDLGRKRGYVTFDEVLEAVPDTKNIEPFLVELDFADIPLVETPPTPEPVAPEAPAPSAAQPDAGAILENISAAYKSLAGTDWQGAPGGRGPAVLVANLLKSIRASNPQYTQEDLARDLHLVDRNPDLLTKDGASISFLYSTVAKERKAKPVIFKDAQGRSFPYYAITFVKETPAREAPPSDIKVGDVVSVPDGTVGTVEKIEGGVATIVPRGFENTPRRYSYSTDILTPESPDVMRSSTVVETDLAIDPKLILAKFAATTYENRPVKLATKELLQNSFDAVKEALYKGEITKGNIDIAVDQANRTLTITDNGVGMSRDVLLKAFFTLAGTKKDTPPGMRSGGFGNAKLALFTMSESMRIETVRDGVKTVTEVDSAKLLDAVGRVTVPEGTPRSIRAVSSPTKEKNGTVVSIKLKDTWTDSQTGAVNPTDVDKDSVESILMQPWIASDESGNLYDFEITVNGGPTLGVGKKHLEFQDYTKFTTASFPWGDVVIYRSMYKYSYPGKFNKYGRKHTVLSSGAFQFDTLFGSSEMNPYGTAYPYNLILDVKPKVVAGDKNYPFNDTRENWRDSISQSLAALNLVFFRLGKAKGTEDLAATMANTYTIGKVDPFAAGPKTYKSPVKIPAASIAAPSAIGLPDKLDVKYNSKLSKFQVTYDKNGKTENLDNFLDGAQTEPLKGIDTNTPLYHNNLNVDLVEVGRQHGNPIAYMTDIASIFMEMRKALQGVGGNKYYGNMTLQDALNEYYMGIGFDTSYYGLNSKVPFKAMLINPVASKSQTIQGITSNIYNTMVHELAHVEVFSHDANFISAMASMEEFLADNGYYDPLRRAIESTVAKNFNMITKMREAFNDSNTSNVASSIATGDKGKPSRIMEAVRRGSLADALDPVWTRGELGRDPGFSRGAATAAEQQVAGGLPNQGRFIVPEGIPREMNDALNVMEQGNFRQMEGGEAFTKDISCG